VQVRQENGKSKETRFQIVPGLDAVKSYIEGVGAQVAIKLEPWTDRSRVPFSFELTLPQKLFWMPGAGLQQHS